MCIVIDEDCLSMVFNIDNSEHYLYNKLFKWIDKGKGILIYGGWQGLESMGNLST